MRYRVAWTASAQQHLARVWLASDKRQSVTSAAAGIDAELREDPETKGESRRAGVRVLIARPLGVEYEVIPEDRTVYVLSVWTTERTTR
jgi:mRNA-degrading endonuclease RelE of RelBE toxin-antitoxin system